MLPTALDWGPPSSDSYPGAPNGFSKKDSFHPISLAAQSFNDVSKDFFASLQNRNRDLFLALTVSIKENAYVKGDNAVPKRSKKSSETPI